MSVTQYNIFFNSYF